VLASRLTFVVEETATAATLPIKTSWLSTRRCARQQEDVFSSTTKVKSGRQHNHSCVDIRKLIAYKSSTAAAALLIWYIPSQPRIRLSAEFPTSLLLQPQCAGRRRNFLLDYHLKFPSIADKDLLFLICQLFSSLKSVPNHRFPAMTARQAESAFRRTSTT